MVSRCGSNVVSVQHDGSDPNMPISSCFLKLTLETRDAAQIEQIRTELTKAVSSWLPKEYNRDNWTIWNSRRVRSGYIQRKFYFYICNPEKPAGFWIAFSRERPWSKRQRLRCRFMCRLLR